MRTSSTVASASSQTRGADFYTVFARTGTREDGRSEIPRCYLGAHAGVQRRGRTEILAPHPIGELEFKGCKVPAED